MRFMYPNGMSQNVVLDSDMEINWYLSIVNKKGS